MVAKSCTLVSLLVRKFLPFFSGPSKVKVTVKGAAAVDPESELEDTHHVLETKGLIWNAVLNAVDIVKGTNSYYKLQVLESDGGVFKTYCVFRSWGRIGTTIGGTKVEVHIYLTRGCIYT